MNDLICRTIIRNCSILSTLFICTQMHAFLLIAVLQTIKNLYLTRVKAWVLNMSYLAIT